MRPHRKKRSRRRKQVSARLLWFLYTDLTFRRLLLRCSFTVVVVVARSRGSIGLHSRIGHKVDRASFSSKTVSLGPRGRPVR